MWSFVAGFSPLAACFQKSGFKVNKKQLKLNIRYLVQSKGAPELRIESKSIIN